MRRRNGSPPRPVTIEDPFWGIGAANDGEVAPDLIELFFQIAPSMRKRARTDSTYRFYYGRLKEVLARHARRERHA